jgi:hypothetical protein
MRTFRSLPEIDLAQFCGMAETERWRALMQFEFGRPRLTYRPTRKHLPDILNEQAPLFGPAMPTEWAKVEELVRKDSRGEIETRANLQVARSLYQYVIAGGITGRRYPIAALQVTVGVGVEYWGRTVLVDAGRVIVPFMDPRRSHGLNAAGRRVAFSFMQERVREDPDLDGAGLAIVQFRNSDQREIVVYTSDGLELYSFDELQQLTQRTYAMWAEVEAAREAKKAG